jgi:2-polyprenyl-3-methyl-5-hydroxy-6-metoxy-1,4-benzoquinol methylase
MDTIPATQSSMPTMELETVEKCPICGGREMKKSLSPIDHTVSSKSFDLVDCSNCGFRITSPRPSARSIGSYYESPEYISHTNARSDLQDKLYHAARKWALKHKYQLIAKHQPKGKALDIGCGTGEFLAYLKGRGYTVQGVEPSAKARSQADTLHGIPTVDSLEKVPAQEQFQVITLWHVLEHVPDPRSTFKRLYSLLAEGGLLAIAVPDRESWDAQFFGSNWAAWDVPRHLSHFRRSDIHALIREHGFELIATKPMWLDAFYIAMLSSRYKGSGMLGSLMKGLMIGSVSNLVALFSSRPTSSTLYLAKKTEG